MIVKVLDLVRFVHLSGQNVTSMIPVLLVQPPHISATHDLLQQLGHHNEPLSGSLVIPAPFRLEADTARFALFLPMVPFQLMQSRCSISRSRVQILMS